MKKKIQIFDYFLLLLFTLSSCMNIVFPSKRVTASNSPIVTTTSSPTITFSSTPTQRQATATWYLKTATPILPTPPPDDIGYYEGIIVITQYYTLLGHGFYEEAYQLLSTSSKPRYPIEEYIENGKMWFKKVQILSVVPRHSRRDSLNKRYFIVSIIAWGEGKMSGAALSGEVQTGDLILSKEGSGWKIGL